MQKSDLDKYFNIKSFEGMVIGNDLDSLLSACLLKSKFGLDIVGIYDYQSLWYNSEFSKDRIFNKLKISNISGS